MKYTHGYKNQYAVYAHLRSEGRKPLDERKPIFSIYIYDTCQVYAKEQFKRDYPEYVIDIIEKRAWI